jgi:dihydroflavonol-4-reductase
MARILVTGGSGFIGQHLVAALAARGDTVRILDPAPPPALPARTEHVRGSVLNPALARQALEGVDCVYHLAAIAHLWTKDAADFDRVNVAGTQIMLSAAKAMGTPRFVHCASESILYPPKSRGTVIDETISLRVHDMSGPYTRSKYGGERAAFAAAAAGMNVVIANPTVPVGAGDHNFTSPTAMIAHFLAGNRFYLDCVLNLVDVRDVAAGLILTAEKGRAGERYILGGENLSLAQIVATIARITGRDRLAFRVPPTLALVAGFVSELVSVHLTQRQPTATVEGVRLALRSLPLDNSKARRELGFAPQPVEGAIREAIAWLSDRAQRIAAVAAGAQPVEPLVEALARGPEQRRSVTREPQL